MTLDEILNEWETDSPIDPLKIQEASLGVPKLQSKYLGYLSHERRVLVHFEAEYRKLYREKFEFMVIVGESNESISRGWKLPDGGKILRVDSDMYLKSDEDVINLHLRVERQKEKVTVLTEILKSLANRHWIIRNFLENRKFTEGD